MTERPRKFSRENVRSKARLSLPTPPSPLCPPQTQRPFFFIEKPLNYRPSQWAIKNFLVACSSVHVFCKNLFSSPNHPVAKVVHVFLPNHVAARMFFMAFPNNGTAETFFILFRDNLVARRRLPNPFSSTKWSLPIG
jgi:hypothetical protein